MSLAWLIYWAEILDKLNSIIGGLGFTFVLFAVILGVVTLVNRASNDFKIKIPLKVPIIPMSIGITMLLISAFIPSSKTVYLMIGTQAVQNSGIPQKVIAIINSKLDEMTQNEVKK